MRSTNRYKIAENLNLNLNFKIKFKCLENINSKVQRRKFGTKDEEKRDKSRDKKEEEETPDNSKIPENF